MRNTDQPQIMLLESKLDVCGPARQEYGDNDDEDIVTTTSSDAAESFLKEHPAAKIVIVIDTHCLTTGSFVWKGNRPENYEACSLFEVSATLRSAFSSSLVLTFTDTKGLFGGNIQICFRCRRYPNALPQDPDPEPCLWTIDHPR
jgi:hypothetical protein